MLNLREEKVSGVCSGAGKMNIFTLSTEHRSNGTVTHTLWRPSHFTLLIYVISSFFLLSYTVASPSHPFPFGTSGLSEGEIGGDIGDFSAGELVVPPWLPLNRVSAPLSQHSSKHPSKHPSSSQREGRGGRGGRGGGAREASRGRRSGEAGEAGEAGGWTGGSVLESLEEGEVN